VALEGDQFLTGVRISGPGGEETLHSTALFSFIGADPASEWLSRFAALDDRGFVVTDAAIGREHGRRGFGRRPLGPRVPGVRSPRVSPAGICT
jgi:thioredoxin reductase (NADPH)